MEQTVKPYATGRGWTLYHGDCREVLPTLSGVDAVVTDPPYGISLRCNYFERGMGELAQCRDYQDVYGDGEKYDPTPILSLGVPTVLWGGNHFADRLPASGGWLVWDKQRPPELNQATCELAWTNCVRGVRIFHHLWHGMMRASERGTGYHPTQKPSALYRWVLGLRWIPSGTVLDPYMGSGPCGVAAVELGREYIGIEIDERYCEVAARRLQRAEEDTALFAQAEAEHKQLELGDPS